jgi:glycogen operon protein
LVREPWDCGGLYRLGDFPAQRLAGWNGRSRGDLRRCRKGDERSVRPLGQRISGSPDVFSVQAGSAGRTITFLTANDGFTLADRVSFNRKHNLAIGENDRDAVNHNNSWHHGIEVPSTDPPGKPVAVE